MARCWLIAPPAALFYIAIGVAVLTAIAWWFVLGWDISILRRVATVLVIACPHALGLAVPLVLANTTAMGAKAGILVHDRMALEEARTLDTIVFDKTGTLTEGEHSLVARRNRRGSGSEPGPSRWRRPWRAIPNT